MKKEFDDFTVEYDDSQEIKNAVFDRVMDFFMKHQSFNGESICQSDNPQIDAPIVLSDIADDIIKFNVKWTEE